MSRSSRFLPTVPCQLLVEGNDDRNFFESLLDRLELRHRIDVQSYDGRDRLSGFLHAFVNDRGFEDVRAIGIVRDADSSQDAAFKSIVDILSNLRHKKGVDLSIPTVPQQFAEGFRSVGIMILADAEGHGMLESVILETLINDPRWPCVERFIECLRSLSSDEIRHPEKSYVHAYLAGTASPHISVGHAAKRGVFDLDHAAFAEICDFLKRLASCIRNESPIILSPRKGSTG